MHVDTNLNRNHRPKLAKVPVSGQQFAVELCGYWWIRFPVDQHHPRLRMVGGRQCELGGDGEHEWTR